MFGAGSPLPGGPITEIIGVRPDKLFDILKTRERQSEPKPPKRCCNIDFYSF